ncbi:MAG: Fic family protein [bacterium]|nr:Fic family protein [bacterium]MDD5353635.1 Fic family protein [bacterium]MDD5756588.1 Fic family protein [bacterium]
MKLPEPAPKWQSILETSIEKIMDIINTGKLNNIIAKANDEYVYWDKLKYFKFPEGIGSEFAWGYLKLNRSQQLKKINIKDKKGDFFKYWLPDSVLRDLHYIDQQASGQILVDDPSTHTGEKERYLVSSIMEEAIASSQLEGAATTREKAKAMLREGKKPENTSEQMILNNYITIKNIKDLLKEPLSGELIRKIHASIVKDTLENPEAVGRFRKPDEEVQVVDENDGQVLYDPPKAEELEERIAALCNYINSSAENEFVHPVIKAIILHFNIGYIHPFVDGNGRTARALFYWFLLKNKYWLFEFLSISRILLRAPAQYARSYLYTELDDLDLTYFVTYNLRAICLSLESLKQYLAKKQQEIKESQKFIRKYPGLNHRQYELLYHAISHSDAVYSIQYIQNTYDIVYQTARADLLSLEKDGFLEKTKIGKKFVFIPTKNIHSKLKGIK